MIGKDKIKKRMLKVGTGVTALMIILGSTALANNKAVVKKMDAHYGTIQIVYNGVNRTGEFAPFIGTTADDKNGSTYVPLRVMSEIFEKNVQWNQATRTATVTDGNSGMEAFWRNQVAAKDIEISRLNEKIKDLEKNEDKKSDSLSDTEKKVRKNHDTYKKVSFDIRLKGDSKDVEAQIEFDGRRYRDEWDDLSERDIERYIDDIYSDVKKDFSKANFSGYIKDTDSRDKVVTFETNSRGDLTYKFDGSSSSSDTRSLERKLEKNYENEFDGFKVESIKVTKKSNDVTYTVNGRINYADDWNSMSESSLRRTMENIESDIQDEYRRAEVEGSVYDTKERETIAKYRSGSLRDKKEVRR